MIVKTFSTLKCGFEYQTSDSKGEILFKYSTEFSGEKKEMEITINKSKY